jgi:hypothetical protein
MHYDHKSKNIFIYKLFNKVIRLLKALVFAIRNENQLNQIINWKSNSFTMPAPHFIKQTVVLRNVIQGSTIIETGTHTGNTSNLLLSASDKVFTIEPDEILFAKAKNRFMGNKSIQVLNGTSEELFPNLLPQITGDISFWLDGHFSGVGTFKGKVDSPIKSELFEIQKNLPNFRKICVMIDDVRCFNPKIEIYSDYPPIDFLTNWANSNEFSWNIENDIFIAKNYE